MCSHRVRLCTLEEVNSELIDWLKEAHQKQNKVLATNEYKEGHLKII